MKRTTLIHLLTICSLLTCLSPSLNAQEEGHYTTISGVVRDKTTKKKIESANISILKTLVGTVTNADGFFTLKINDSLKNNPLIISHIGYQNATYRLTDKDLSQDDKKEITIYLSPNSQLLEEVTIIGNDAQQLVEEASSKIKVNYPEQEHLLVGFYREVIKKRRKYIQISEAVIHLQKSPYTQGINRDRVQVYKGRMLISQKASDTLLIKMEGGPHLSIDNDLVKNRLLLLDKEEMELYHFKLAEATVIDNRPHYVIAFEPKGIITTYPLYYGKLFIDKETTAISRAEFNFSMDDRKKVTQAILRKKPAGLRFKPESITNITTYKQHEGKTYLNYMRHELRFKCDWKRKLFSTNYTILSEMVITDSQKEQLPSISRKESFKRYQSLSDKITTFYDPSFWEDYNIIEPSESLEKAVEKLKKH